MSRVYFYSPTTKTESTELGITYVGVDLAVFQEAFRVEDFGLWPLDGVVQNCPAVL